MSSLAPLSSAKVLDRGALRRPVDSAVGGGEESLRRRVWTLWATLTTLGRGWYDFRAQVDMSRCP